MTTQTVKSKPIDFQVDHGHATTVSLIERLKRAVEYVVVKSEQARAAREIESQSQRSQDALRDLPVEEKLRLGLYQLMD